MKQWEISSLQAGWLVAGAVALTGHALAVSYFLQAGGRDAWMAGLSSLPLGILAIWSLVRLSRIYPGKTIVQYLPKLLGYLGYPLSCLYILYYLTVVIFTLRLTTDWMVETILPETPSWVMGALYIAAVLYAAMGGLDVIARINQFVLPVLTFLGFLVAFGTMPDKEYSLLLPMFEFGLGPLAAVTGLGLGYFGETSILAMFTAYVRPNDRPRLLRAYLLASLFVLMTLTGPLAGSIATLGYRVAQNMAYPTFQHWLMLNIADFFERTDLLAVHQWLAGAYARCALFLLLSVKGLTQLIPRNRLSLNWILAVAGIVTIVTSELLFPVKADFDRFVTAIYLPGGAVLGIIIPPMLVIVAALRGLTPVRGNQSRGL